MENFLAFLRRIGKQDLAGHLDAKIKSAYKNHRNPFTDFSGDTMALYDRFQNERGAK